MRVSGVASWSSSLPDVSSDDRLEMKVAVARPMSTKPMSANASWRKPAAVVMSIPGMRVRKTAAIAGEALRVSSSDFDAAAITTP